jgi:uncharacterized protein with HEPN domain
LNGTLNLLTNIGEDVSKVSTELKSEYTNIAWQQIKGLRNKVVHDYSGIDLQIVYDVIVHDLPELKLNIEKIIRTKIIDKVFDKNELEATKGSKYYSHIDYDAIE